MRAAVFLLPLLMGGCVDLADDLLDRDGDGEQTWEVGGLDCDDSDAFINSLAEELCGDAKDNDCDGAVDDRGVGERTWHQDGDQDGWGDDAVTRVACDPPELFVARSGDCDDGNREVHPDQAEICDGVDNDCSGVIDDGGEERSWFPDRDGDSWGDPTQEIVTCTPPAQHVARGEDCDDTNADVRPDTPQDDIWYDGIDQDCDGRDDWDADGDGFRSALEFPDGDDCNDFDATVSPEAPELFYDAFDQDCDPTNEWDRDNDGHDIINAPGGGTDCNDLDPLVHPDATETFYDGLDQDCRGDDFDADGDGYPSEIEADGGDCDDFDPARHPGATEVWYDGVDQDCAGDDDDDQDHDGFTSALEAGGPDCDDTRADTWPGAPEVWYDGIDQGCDGGDDFDADRDLVASLAEGAGLDCDDTRADVHPGAVELWYDGVDQACDGGEDFDADGDGHLSEAEGAGDDCDDFDAQAHPGGVENWYQPADDLDCDPTTEWDQDEDGHTVAGAPEGSSDDCEDEVFEAHPGSMFADVPYDGIDHDCDGRSDWDLDEDGYDAEFAPSGNGDDCDDSNPNVSPAEPAEICGNTLDDNCDGSAEPCQWEDGAFYGDLAAGELAGVTTSEGIGTTHGGMTNGVLALRSGDSMDLAWVEEGPDGTPILSGFRQMTRELGGADIIPYDAAWCDVNFLGGDELIVVDKEAVPDGADIAGAMFVFSGPAVGAYGPSMAFPMPTFIITGADRHFANTNGRAAVNPASSTIHCLRGQSGERDRLFLVTAVQNPINPTASDVRVDELDMYYTDPGTLDPLPLADHVIARADLGLNIDITRISFSHNADGPFALVTLPGTAGVEHHTLALDDWAVLGEDDPALVTPLDQHFVPIASIGANGPSSYVHMRTDPTDASSVFMDVYADMFPDGFDQLPALTSGPNVGTWALHSIGDFNGDGFGDLVTSDDVDGGLITLWGPLDAPPTPSSSTLVMTADRFAIPISHGVPLGAGPADDLVMVALPPYIEGEEWDLEASWVEILFGAGM